MDKNAIKKYAVWARTELIDRVTQKALQYGITEKESVPASATSVNGVVLSKDEMQQRKALLERIAKKGYKHVIEEVAYTWFNRFSALRFMEVNGYLPSRVRVFTDEHNQFNPQILTEAISLEMEGLDMEKVYAYKDANDDEGLFKYLIIVQCNALNPVMPGMFQRIADYTELLFPDNLLRDGSAIQRMIEWIPEDDWKDAVQIIGWLYQFYNIEPKAEVFAKKTGKIAKEEIPAATQLFTPDWIVRYMVENSLGRLWIEGHPNNELRTGWHYYLDEAEQEPAVQTQLAAIRKEYASITPEQIKCIDPCAGSGHILAYMFDVLMQIYETYGYTTHEAVRSIIENNLYGLDIDDRAAQLAYFAVMMKARKYDRRFLVRKGENGNPDVPQPRVYEIVESNGLDRSAIEHFIGGEPQIKAAMDSLVSEMHDAKEYGSILNITSVDFSLLYRRFDEVLSDVSIFNLSIANDLLPFVKIAEALAQKYDVVVTNPPYMAISAANSRLADFVKRSYLDSKSDLFAVFMERCREMVKPNGLQAMITMHAWMFLSSYETLRNKLQNITILNMAHMGSRGFEEISGEIVQTTAFVFGKFKTAGYLGNYCRLTDGASQQDKETMFLSGKHRFVSSQRENTIIPGEPVAYWISPTLRSTFQHHSLEQVGDSYQGIITGDVNRFLRLWFEADYTKITFGEKDYHVLGESKTYYPYIKGGGFRKWAGNQEYVISWFNDGKDLVRSRTENRPLFFKNGITWSLITTTDLSFRWFHEGFLCDVSGSSYYAHSRNDGFYILAFLNSVVSSELLHVINPTINVNIKDVMLMPIVRGAEQVVCPIAEKNISISEADWNSFETSWEFRKHPLVPTPNEWAEQRNSQFANARVAKFSQLAWHYDQWVCECQYRFDSLKENEETLNRIFIDLYGLQDELVPDVAPENVTVCLADRKRDIKSLISYAVGCMFGRYSLDVPGLAYAGGEWDDSKYVTFKADKDSIIPICDDEYFADDIVGRFIRFIEVVYGKDALQENLRFIADTLGGSGQPKDVIRNYFLNDFYADHLKIYQKRPIYWLFDSGKKGGFRALVYMHRYQPDTIARMRTDYVHEQQARYRTAISDLEQRIASASTSERVKLSKRLKTLQEQATEIQGYEEKIHHLADQYIAIDLDDGVKKNYEIFKDVLAKLK